MLGLLVIVAKILFVVVFFSLCIFVHELGHLLVALWQRLHVQRFSVGFGRKLWGTTHHGVEYIVSALPFGGYVALPQLDPAEEPKTADGAPLPRASPFSRMVTAAAGPAANIVFGFVLALFIWWFGVDVPAPAKYCDVTTVPEASPEYRAGLRSGDRILAVNGRAFTEGWTDVSRLIALSPGAVTLHIRRAAHEQDIAYRPAPNPEHEGLGYPFFDVDLPIVIRRVLPDSPAERAGLQAQDRILRLNGEAIQDVGFFIDKVTGSQGAPLSLVVERGGREVTITDLRAKAERLAGKTVYQIGVHFGLYVRIYPNPWRQFVAVFTQTRDTLIPLFTKGSLVKARHMSGPVGIVQIIWYKVKYGGFREGLAFVIFVTFSLAFVNILPIPVLDGGHVLFAVIETAIRRPIPVFIARGLQNVFVVLLIMFLLYVTFFDVKRIPRFWHVLGSAREEPAQKTTAPAAPAAGQPAVPAK